MNVRVAPDSAALQQGVDVSPRDGSVMETMIVETARMKITNAVVSIKYSPTPHNSEWIASVCVSVSRSLVCSVPII